MADPFTQLGISRRPAYEMFGTPDISRGGWSQGTRQAVLADRAALDEAQAQQDERDAMARKRDAEKAADEFVRAEPSARERFLSDRPEIVGSPRFNEIATFQQMQPSYADERLKNTVAMRIAEPEARKVFLDAVAQGHGTLAAQDMANTFIAKRKAAGELGKAGYSPDEAEQLVAERHDPAHVNYHIARKKEGTLFHRDPEAQAAEKHLQMLMHQAKLESEDISNSSGQPLPGTVARIKAAQAFLDNKYADKYLPKPQAAPPPATSDEAKKILMGLIKKPATP